MAYGRVEMIMKSVGHVLDMAFLKAVFKSKYQTCLL
ncbi:MAG: hypothetical protein L3J69_00980 [Desulfobacula sp.]|nr:hypothetical protein [Desulfobacula sp.]